MLGFLYRTAPGRVILKALTCRAFSRAAGAFMDSPVSKPLIKLFIKKYGIDMRAYVPEDYASFNAFFTRKIRPELRPFDPDPAVFCSPCDGLLSAYRIAPDSRFEVKQSVYSVASLLGSDPEAARFDGGVCLVFRLCVNHYHRYHYIDGGTKTVNRFLPGRLHTVRPIALENAPVFTENCREYCLMHTDNFGTVAQVEVGAMLVGRISNNDGAGPTARGVEKGRFLYGGSTVILLLEKGSVDLPETYFKATESGRETPVLCGQSLGRRKEST